MEHELHDFNVIRVPEDEGDIHDFTMLLDPSQGEAPTTNNDVVSEVYNTSVSSKRSFVRHSEDDLRFPAKNRNRSLLQVFIRPIIACSWQFIVLVMLITFIIQTESTAYPIVPRHLAAFYAQHPQGTTSAITLVGSLLSLLSTKAFSEAIRFATVVSLRNPCSRDMTLHSLYARITVGSGNTLFDFGKGRRVWTIVSLVSLVLFTIQTAAWTTILTPRATDIPYQTSFQDFNYTNALINGSTAAFLSGDWAPAWDSGYIAATEGTNLTQYISFSGYILNGTSRGISPMTHTFDNWTTVEAIQQGLTAEVNCKATPASDPYIRINQTSVASGIVQVFLCCNCSSGSPDEINPVLFYEDGPYLAFTTCPMNNITVYLNSNYGNMNQTCTISPRWLNVNVTNVRGGFVTLETMARLPDIPFNSSMIIQSAIKTLKIHFVESQTMSRNHIIDTIRPLMEGLPDDMPDSQFKEFMTKKMTNYIRGVFEYAASFARSTLLCTDSLYCPQQQSFPSTTHVHAIVWGQAPRYRLIIAISPLAVMITTITIILASLYMARRLDLDHVASFNAMDTLHIITACSWGNVHALSFPDYSKGIDLFSKGVGVELSEIEAGRGAAGFRFSPR